MPDDCCVAKDSMKPRIAEIFHELNTYIYIYTYIYSYIHIYIYIYIYLLLSLYNRSILDIEHSPYYIALGSTLNHRGI